MSDLSDPMDAATRLEEAERESCVKNPIVPTKLKRGTVICIKCDYPNDRYTEGYATCSDCVEPVHVEEENQARIQGYKR